MPSKKPTADEAIRALRSFAKAFPDVEEGLSCKGTVLECPTFGVRKKVFLFIGPIKGHFHLRLKLRESQREVAKLSAKEPARYSIGSGGWAKAVFTPEETPPIELLEKWIDESYRVVVGDALKPARGKRKRA